MKELTIFILTIFLFFNLSAQNTTSVYVSAHPDDWQLFMNPNAYKSIKNSDEKVVFLHTTAGDNNAGTGNNDYYLAREEGSLRAIRFMSNTFGSGASLGTNMDETTVNINGHMIKKFTYRNAVAYFLRLPDNHVETSLYKLYEGIASSIPAIDGSTTYNSLDDLRNTLKSIVELESNGSNINFNIADDDNSINPGDHGDHIYSSKIMQDIANTLGDITMNLYTEYHTSSLTQNVFGDDFMICAATWGATASGLSDRFHNSTWDNVHNSWVGKQYFRTINVGSSGTNNIALNKPTSSSSNEPNHPSSHAVDNNFSLGNYWGANPYLQWWQVDLQDVYDVNKIKITNYYDGNRYYQYNVQGSLDGVNWTNVTDFNNNTIPATAQGNSFNINNTARYLRVNMNFNSANVGVHIIEFEAYGNLANTSTNNIALNKPTSSSSNEPNHPSSHAVDNNFSLGNYWGANPYLQWWQVDLQDVYDVNKIKITNYYDGNRYYQYNVQGSLDGVNWTNIIDFNNNTTPATAQGNSFNINSTARYLRVNMNFNSANVGVHIIEFEAYGNLQFAPQEGQLFIYIQNETDPDLLNEDKFKVSPNPSGGGFNIDLSSSVGEKVNYFIINQSGNILLEGEFGENHGGVGSLDLNGYKNGSYFIYMKTKNSKAVSKKLMLLNEY